MRVLVIEDDPKLAALLVKPFAFGELLARLRALVRRGPVARPAVLSVGGLRLDPATRRVWRGDRRSS